MLTSDELDNLKERKAKVEETAEQEKQGLNGVFEVTRIKKKKKIRNTTKYINTSTVSRGNMT